MPVRPIALPRSALLSPQTRRPTPTVTVREPWLEDSVPTRELLDSQPAHYLVHGEQARPDLRLVQVQGSVWVVKDFAARTGWLRQTLGRWLIARELSALQALDGLDGIPQSVVRIDAFAFAYRYVEGVSLDAMRPEYIGAEFFDRLETLTAAMHRRGIVHLQLRDGSNVVVTPEQEPVLLDFRSHLRLPTWAGGLLRLLSRLDVDALHRLWDRYMLAVLSTELKPARRIRS
jgi:hypothetical protein